MIKGIKVNYYQILRSKAFWVISLLLILGAIFCGFFIKFLADDVFGWYTFVEEAFNDSYNAGYKLGSKLAQEQKGSSQEGEDTEESNPDLEVEVKIGADEVGKADLNVRSKNKETEETESEESVEHADTEENKKRSNSDNVILKYLDELHSSNSLIGVLVMDFGSNASYMLMCIFVSLYVGNTFKSRYHINLYSLNIRPYSLVGTQMLALISAFLFVDLVCFGSTLAVSYILCQSYSFVIDPTIFQYLAIYSLTGLTYLFMAYMISYIRKGPVLSIILCIITLIGIPDIFISFAALFRNEAAYLSPNAGMNMISFREPVDTKSFIFVILSLCIYILLFAGISFYVAEKRDAY